MDRLQSGAQVSDDEEIDVSYSSDEAGGEEGEDF
mgnify:CR=1 FL=1